MQCISFWFDVVHIAKWTEVFFFGGGGWNFWFDVCLTASPRITVQNNVKLLKKSFSRTSL